MRSNVLKIICQVSDRLVVTANTYAVKMIHSVGDHPFNIPVECCIALNNIDYTRRQLDEITTDLETQVCAFVILFVLVNLIFPS